tara:strand:+ start:4315 stop:4866 length:552 start_codon:yes stop_codon:yes gene_type:complete
MLNFLRLSKKKKVNVQDVMDLYFEHLNDVIQDGFVEIKDFINNNNNLESSPNISDSEIDTFRLFILLYNIYNLESYFEEYQISILRTKIIDKTLIYIDNNEELAMEKFLNHEEYFKELVDEYKDGLKATAFSLFNKYDINNCQGDLFRRKKEPNPVFLHELKSNLKFFLWNWDDYLKKYRIVF